MVLTIRKTFHRFLRKTPLRIIMVLVVHYNLELHQMDMKIVFLNENLEEEVYMDQTKDFFHSGKRIHGV